MSLRDRDGWRGEGGDGGVVVVLEAGLGIPFSAEGDWVVGEA